MERPSILFRISSVFFRCQKYVKKGYREMTKKLPWDFKKCARSLHFTLLLLDNCIWKKKILKYPLFKDYKTSCQQDHSDSKQLLGDDLADNVKTATATHWTSPFQIRGWYYLLVLLRIQYTFYSSNSKSTNHSKTAIRTSSIRIPPHGGIRTSSLGWNETRFYPLFRK